MSVRRAQRLGLLIAVCAAICAAGAATAVASKIVYTCAPNLCAVEPESGVSAQITSDGEQAAYAFPSLSLDGTQLAAARGSAVYVGAYGSNLTAPWLTSRSTNDVALSADGSAIGESHSYVENRYGCPLTGGCLELVDQSRTFFQVGPSPAAVSAGVPGGGGVGFLGAGSLLSSYYTIGNDSYTVCLVADPRVKGAICEPKVSSTRTLFAPEGSRDGKLIAISVAAPEPSKEVALNLYDAASGALVRQLSTDGSYASFSPDGSEVAFSASDGWVYLVPTAGGTPQRLVRGLAPSWGGGSGPGPAIGSKKLRLRKGRIAVKVRCEGTVDCRGSLRISKGKKTLAARSFRVKGGTAKNVWLLPTPAGLRKIEAAASQKVVIQIKPSKGRVVFRDATLKS